LLLVVPPAFGPSGSRTRHRESEFYGPAGLHLDEDGVAGLRERDNVLLGYDEAS